MVQRTAVGAGCLLLLLFALLLISGSILDAESQVDSNKRRRCHSVDEYPKPLHGHVLPRYTVGVHCSLWCDEWKKPSGGVG